MINTKTQLPDYLFTPTVRFVQKAIVFHPVEPKFLIIKRSSSEFIRPNTWDIPGGSIHYGELHREGLKREVLEETGLTISNVQEFHVITHYDKTKPMYFIIVGSTCTATDDKITVSSEHEKYAWITISDFLNLNSTYSFIQDRTFDIHSTDFIFDFVFLAQKFM